MAKAQSHSGRSEYQRCPRSFYLGRELRLEPDTDKVSLRMGRAFATALEHRDPVRAREGYMEGWPAGMALGSQELLEIEQSRLMAELYLQRYVDPPNLQTEVGFNHPLVGPGQLDGVIETKIPLSVREVNGTDATARYSIERVGIECKFLTANFWRNADERKLAIDSQVTAYFLAMRDAGTPLDKMLYRVTFKPTIKPDSRIKNKDGSKGETIDAYLARLRARVLAEPDKVFKQYELYRTDDDLERFLEEADEINAQIRLSRRKKAWPKNTQSCTMFGECSFLSLCRGEPGLEGKYRKKPTLPKLSAAQKRVVLAMSDSLTETITLQSIARQSMTTGAGASKSLSKLVDLEVVEAVSDFEGVVTGAPGEGPMYRLTDVGNEIVRRLK